MAKQFIPIKLDKVRNLRYNMRALERIEDQLELPMSKINFNNLSIKYLKIIIWAGLVHEDNELTPDAVLDLIDDYSDITTVSDAMGKALTESFGGSNKKK